MSLESDIVSHNATSSLRLLKLKCWVYSDRAQTVQWIR